MRLSARRTAPACRPGSPIIAAAPGRATVGGARFAVFFTAAAWVAYVVEQILRLVEPDVTLRTVAETSVYLAMVTVLTASGCAYLLTRVGYFERIRGHRRVPRSTIDDFFDQALPEVTVIVPSYR